MSDGEQKDVNESHCESTRSRGHRGETETSQITPMARKVSVTAHPRHSVTTSSAHRSPKRISQTTASLGGLVSPSSLLIAGALTLIVIGNLAVFGVSRPQSKAYRLPNGRRGVALRADTDAGRKLIHRPNASEVRPR